MIFDEILETVKEFSMIRDRDRIVIGLSGGADSMCLLRFFYWLSEKWNIVLTAVHVNHMLRSEADADEEFVRGICGDLGIPLKVYRYDIGEMSKTMKTGVEDAGRKMRYQAFAETADELGMNRIAVAHNINDNTETVLLNLCRGTGIKGLCGIPPVRGRIIRPLIRTERRDIESYLNEAGIAYVSDKTNQEPKYARNLVRLEAVPVLERLTDAVNEVIYRGCRLISEENDYLDGVAEDEYIKMKRTNSVVGNTQAGQACVNKTGNADSGVYLNAKDLAELNPVIGRRVIRRALFDIGSVSNVTYEQSEEVLSLARKQTGKRVMLPNGTEAFKEYDSLVISKIKAPMSYCYKLRLGELCYVKEIDSYILADRYPTENITNLQMMYTRLFDYDKIKNSLELRTRKDRDFIRVARMGGTKKLKDYFIDSKTPRTQRDIPLLADGSEIIWLVGRKLANSDYEIFEEKENTLYVSVWRKN